MTTFYSIFYKTIPLLNKRHRFDPTGDVYEEKREMTRKGKHRLGTTKSEERVVCCTLKIDYSLMVI